MTKTPCGDVCAIVIFYITPGQSGAQRENRTLDLFITSEMLYRLSYLGDAEMLAGQDREAHGEFGEIHRQFGGGASFVPGR